MKWYMPMSLKGWTRYRFDGSIEPALAKSWEISEDGRVYTFQLNEGVTFHDGSAFTADDVKFSLDRARADSSTNAQKRLFTGITSVDVISPLEVRITLDAPYGGFITNLAWGDAVILAPETVDQAKNIPYWHRTVSIFQMGARRSG